MVVFVVLFVGCGLVFKFKFKFLCLMLTMFVVVFGVDVLYYWVSLCSELWYWIVDLLGGYVIGVHGLCFMVLEKVFGYVW